MREEGGGEEATVVRAWILTTGLHEEELGN